MRTQRSEERESRSVSGVDQLVDLLDLTERLSPGDGQWTPLQLGTLFAEVDFSTMLLPEVHLVWVWSLLLERGFGLRSSVAHRVACWLHYALSGDDARVITEYLVQNCETRGGW